MRKWALGMGHWAWGIGGGGLECLVYNTELLCKWLCKIIYIFLETGIMVSQVFQAM
ncbi:hypothetical protein [Aetokthonos hydrillicola]|jgi:hypothetical protein|uniref:hypothetical protein n=1 Tax=Aetokthonos hydrillicola TaxID=1550245 RepID=UPI0030DC836E|nr:hypothetical protein [Aetokthonos hydrillicola CCALA 1050]